MKRATITLPDVLELALSRTFRFNRLRWSAAVREYLGERVYLPRVSKLRIRPASRAVVGRFPDQSITVHHPVRCDLGTGSSF